MTGQSATRLMIVFTPLYIDGEERPSSTGRTYDVHNAQSKDLVSRAAAASARDCQDAIEAAASAFHTWERAPLAERRNYLLKAADLLETDKYKENILEAIPAETSIPDYFAIRNQHYGASLLREAGSSVSELKGETYPSVGGGQVLTQRRAHGVVFAIAPWNAPVSLTIRALAIPLICGNTVVLKTSEVCPRSQYIVANLFAEVGLPKGVLNVVHMSQEDSPPRCSEIIAHSAVKKINFTGGDRVGRILAAEAAKYLKPCILELGGKAPVLEDADISRAAQAITYGSLVNSGQICMSTERVIVQRKVAPQLTSALVEQFRRVESGGPEGKLAAQFSESSAQNIQAMLNEAREAGARFLVGDGSRNGAVVQPHLIAGVKPGMRLWERETFGPVVILVEVDTCEEAIELANASDYSLSASIWTQDVNTALDSAMDIRAGCVNINGPTFHTELARQPCGLSGASGYGNFSVNDFTDLRLLVIHPAASPHYPLLQ